MRNSPRGPSPAKRTRSSTWVGPARWLLVILPVIAIIVGGYSLFRNLPYDYYPFFWDGGQLLEEVSDPDFSTAGPLESNQYTLRKYAYGFLIHLAVARMGFSGVLAVNLFWFGVLLTTGIWALGRLRRAAPGFPWVGVLAFAAGMISIPFVHKYIGLTKPTIQSMALWFGLLLVYEFQYNPRATIRGRTILPGLICALLVLTDFPKWAVILAPAVLITEIVTHRAGVKDWGKRFAVAVARTTLILSWSVAGFLVLSLLVPNYFRNNIGITLLGHGAEAEMIRPALSWNFPIFLWVLGGLLVVLFVAFFRNGLPSRPIRRSPALVLALAVVGLFSLLIWPRSARMFAVVVPYALLLFGRMVQAIYDSSCADKVAERVATADDPRRLRWITSGLVAAVIVLGSLALRAPGAGACFTLPTGVRKVNQFVAGDPRLAADSLLGAYVQPLFQLGVPPGHQWHYVPVYMWSDMRWVCSGDFVDEVILEEQFLHGRVPLSWRTHQDRMLDTFRGEPAVARFRNDFYASSWYLVESNFQDGQLAFLLRRAADLENPMWRLHFVAGLADDSLTVPEPADSNVAIP